MPRPAEAAPARRAAFEILRRVETAGAWASILLERPPHGLDARDRALVRRIVLGVLRDRAALDHVVERSASRPVERIDPAVRVVLRIAAYELLRLDRVPDHAAVDEAVRLARASGGRAGRAAAGFVNGVARAVARGGRALWPPPPAEGDVEALALAESHPVWWTRRLVERRGWSAAAGVLAADNAEPPIALRPNATRLDVEALVRALEAAGVESEPGRVAPEARLVVAGADRLGPLLDAGLAVPQDEASQLVGSIGAPAVDARVLDLCAAPGSKATQLAASPGVGLVVAADRHAGRLRRLERLRRRLGLDRLVAVVADALRGPPFAPVFDLVLVDAPCSGTGTLRRHPEIRWRLSPDDPARLAGTQRRLLAAGAALVRPGGRLVYAVCSIEPEEGPQVVAAFLAEQPSFRREPLGPRLPSAAAPFVDRDGALSTEPGRAGLDGFHAVSLVRGGRSG